MKPVTVAKEERGENRKERYKEEQHGIPKYSLPVRRVFLFHAPCSCIESAVYASVQRERVNPVKGQGTSISGWSPAPGRMFAVRSSAAIRVSGRTHADPRPGACTVDCVAVKDTNENSERLMNKNNILKLMYKIQLNRGFYG
jgi:hypothetical protein